KRAFRRRGTDNRHRDRKTARRCRRAARARRRARYRCARGRAYRRACRPNTQRIPGSTDVSYAKLTPRTARWDRSVPLSRTHIPFAVVQEGSCSVHAEAAFALGRRRLCCVNVKLTTGLARKARLIVSRTLYGSPVLLQVAGERVAQAASNRVWSSRGEGWELPICLARKDRHGKGGLLRALLFSLDLHRRFLCCCALAQAAQSRLSGSIAPASAAAHGICHRNAAGTAATSPAGGSTRTDPDAAFRADGLCRLDRGHSPARAAAPGTGELDHRCRRVHSESL